MSSRSLLPREHGAWVQLALPLLAALAAGRPGWVAAGLVAAVVCAFFAHEPLLVWLGHRGRRHRDARGAQAALALGVAATAAAAFGLTALLAAPAAVRWASLAFFLPAAAIAPLVWRRAERSTAGEVGVALALSGAAPAIALAAGVEPRAAWLHGAIWAAVFVSQTLAARGVLALAKKRTPSRRLLDVAASVAAASLVAAVAAWATGVVGWGVPGAVALPAALVGLVALRPPPPRRLLVVGLVMAAADAPIVALLALAPV